MIECQREGCDKAKAVFKLKIIPTNHPNLATFPKWIPQIKAICPKCGNYIKFASQTPELIEKFNDILNETAVAQ